MTEGVGCFQNTPRGCSSTLCTLPGIPQPHEARLWPSLSWMGSFRPRSTHRAPLPGVGALKQGFKSLLLCFLHG